MCVHCGGKVQSPTKRVALVDAVEHHLASCPSLMRIKGKR